MLKQLFIKNYALIRELSFSPNNQLNTITGETGAGKSIMLGALGLILGQRADSNALLDADEKCVIEGVFDIHNYNLKDLFTENDLDFLEETTIRREINTSGKSRAFINDTPTTLDVLKELGEQLIDIHSQHDTQFLKKGDIQLGLVDAYAKTNVELEEYKSAFKKHKKLFKELQKLKEAANSSKTDFEYNTHLYNELSELNPKEQEEDLLEKEMVFIDNIELIKTNLITAQQLLDNPDTGANNQIYESTAALKEISSLSEKYSSLFERITSLQYELKDIVTELESENENIEYDQEHAETVKIRYDQLQRLLKKHAKTTASELIEIKTELETQLESVASFDDKLISLEKETTEALAIATQKGEVLSDKRKSFFTKLCTEIQQLVSELGMPDAKFEIDHKKGSPNENGLDEIAFLFSANKGRTPSPLKNAASGGEISRLMFALKHIMADKVALPTVVFDEIDTGISGEIALQMGDMMKKMSKNHQIITITHLPQIASKGHAHFFVYKDKNATQTESNIKELNQEDRILEIAQMIGGKTPSENAFLSARELLGS